MGGKSESPGECGPETASWNIAATLLAVAGERPESPAIIEARGEDFREWNFAELAANSGRFALRLAEAGVRPGERVILMARPSMQFVALTFALFRLGAVVVLIDPGMGYRNLLRCIGSVRPSVFLGIAKAWLFRHCCRTTFSSVRQTMMIGGPLRGFTPRREPATPGEEAAFPLFQAGRNDLAAIIFTTGSTGPPKGVRYSHGIFFAQLAAIRDYYGITSADRDQPAFPLFALFSTALGACAVIPDMDPTRPAKVDPRRFVRSLQRHRITYSFGSPALWNVVSRYCLEHGERISGLRKVLMAGAPVSGELVGRVQRIMDPHGEIHTPYGATESLPIASIEGREIVDQTWPQTRRGMGTCVGRPLPGIDIRVMEVAEKEFRHWRQVRLLEPGEVGEIIVRGPVVTRAYDNNETETLRAKIEDEDGSFWHRMGDMGRFDAEGRLWFCGRKAHRVLSAEGPLYSVCCEAIFNEHPHVFRSALVGIGSPGAQRPVIVVELLEKSGDEQRLLRELAELGAASPLTRSIRDFLIHPDFPVDIRHNAKIFREKLAIWAAQRVSVRK